MEVGIVSEVEKQILTNQLCILATLKTTGYKTLLPIQIENIENRIKETIALRDSIETEN